MKAKSMVTLPHNCIYLIQIDTLEHRKITYPCMNNDLP